VLRAITDASFPAGKEELLRVAQAGNAPPEVIQALQEIPAEQYENKHEVAQSVRTEADSDLQHSAAQHAKQAAQGGKPGLSEKLRDAPKPPVEEELDR
jgi:hypothetical protein